MRGIDLRIGIVTFPISQAGVIPLANLIAVLSPLSSELYLITGGAGYSFFAENRNVHLYAVEHSARGKVTFTRAVDYVWTQLRISRQMMRLARNVNLWIFFIGGEGLVLPMLTAKLLGRGAVVASAGSGLKVAQARGDPLAKVAALLQGITYRLSDRIIMYSERLVDEHGLQKYRNKISIAKKHFIDFDKFKAKRKFDDRDNLVGYIGALSRVKGIPNLLEAIPRILAEKSDVKFVIGGDGELKGEVEKYLAEENLNGKAGYVGWIPHDELPDCLNKLRLLVLPSYTEGLPNIVLEAMACGTPVLATAVGGIPDVITDGETGFIMENNSPECIARDVIRALKHPRLAQMAHNASSLIEREYTYEKAVERYRNILVNLK
ncbi:MAG: hypothetical protein DRI01_08465 [Chloroflexi bacterium]|nr:MAG: hypothetical protein DRI01_08465 [Chloroflexota bacterium]